MALRYYFAYSSLCVLLAAFFPAMLAANKDRRFSKWYIYSAVLLPVALLHAIFLKKPVHLVTVYTHSKSNPTHMHKKTYKAVPKGKKNIVVSPKYIYAVFFSKLIFGAFMGIVLFAIFRTFVYDTKTLRLASVIFAALFSLFLSMVEICRLSRFPLIADEITKRAIIIAGISLMCSLPFFLLKTFVFDKTLPAYSDFLMFACTVSSFALFVVFLLKRQNYYYAFFYKFSDYCVISMCAYAIFSAVTLIWMSIYDIRNFIHAIAMPMQIFNPKYLSGVGYIDNISYIYSSAFVHLFIEIVILFSGLSCRSFKRKELLYRVEYRTKAFRMSRKPILRRHIPKPTDPMEQSL